jgi:putative Flp pilus-assembly TadE/G-like protein
MPRLFRIIRPRLPGDGQHGQSLVLVALWLTVLLGFAAVAVDVGRFLTERRFLQNAADAAALAAANALSTGKSAAEAEAAARYTLTQNFASDPTGNSPALPSVLPIYEDGHAGEGIYLKDGILIGSTDVRVALLTPVGYTFGRALNLVNQNVGAQARAMWLGGMLPISVRHYVHPPGPEAGAAAPCPDNQNVFMDFFATANTACLGSETDASLRMSPSAGAQLDPVDPDSDPTNHGPVVVILGQGAQPNNGADFRGFIALDIRNFANTTSRLYYNEITDGTGPNTLKSYEAAWIDKGGYPGPDFPAVISPPDPNDQVATMSGNTTGIAIDAMVRRYVPGDEILVTVYPGTVMEIPDFSIAPPSTITLPTTGLTPNPASFKVTRNQSFSGTVDLSTVADTLDPNNPMVLGTLVGADPFTYSPDPVVPQLGSGQTVQMLNATTNNAAPGIYALWIRGEAGSPYLSIKLEPFSVKIGTVTRDFAITADSQKKEAPTVGSSVTFTLVLQNAPNKNTNFGGPVTLSVDTPYPTGTGSVTLGSTSVTPSKNGSSTTLTINTGSMAQGLHRFVVRATGMNSDSTPRPVTHLLPLYVDVSPSSGGKNDEYVDVSGFAVMRLTDVNGNSISAYAITPSVPNPNDPILKRGKIARLVPWS